MKNLIVKAAADNVGNALEDIFPGDEVRWEAGGRAERCAARDKVPFGFKMALADIAPGGDVVCYGEVIGLASKPVRAGECVHVHNVNGRRGNIDAGGGAR